MALRDQPYLPLYVDDFMSDEKLNLCSAEATGVYIRLMCLMHKMNDYGVVTLTKSDKVCDDQIRNFSVLLSKQMPYETDVIFRSICELFERKVIQIKGDKLIQKRMVKDAELSKKRAIAGAKGGKQKSSKMSSKCASKSEANSVNENGIIYINQDISNGLDESNQEDILKNNTSEKKTRKKPAFDHDSKPYKCAVFLDREICSRLPAKSPSSEHTLQSWADAFDKLNRIDGYKWTLIGEALEFSQRDEFWQKNILSGATFRKQFLKIYAKMGGGEDD